MNQMESAPSIGLCVALLLCLCQAGMALAQNGETSSSPAGLSMLVLFLGIGGIIAVFVIRWSQSTGEGEE